MTTITITHTAADGTLVDGDPRPHHQVLKDAGFRWSRNIPGWYLRNSRDRAPRMLAIEQAAEGLRAHGFEVVIDVDSTPRAPEEREAAAIVRSEAREAALLAKAERKRGEAAEAMGAYRQTADMIPLGQPILVGHHSESRHRRALAKMERNFERSMTAVGEAHEADRKAEAAAGRRAHRESGPATVRRIDRIETELRDLRRRLDKANAACNEEWAGRLTPRIEELETDLAYWKRHLATLRETGEYAGYGPADFTKGQRVKANGHPGTVVRINKKSLTVRTDVMPQFPHTFTYERIEMMPESEAP